MNTWCSNTVTMDLESSSLPELVVECCNGSQARNDSSFIWKLEVGVGVSGRDSFSIPSANPLTLKDSTSLKK